MTSETLRSHETTQRKPPSRSHLMPRVRGLRVRTRDLRYDLDDPALTTAPMVALYLLQSDLLSTPRR